MDRNIDYEAAREARNSYAREWRAKNKEKVRETNSRYWARRAERNAQAATTEGGVNHATDATISENR